MKKKNCKVQRIICAFFIGFSCLFLNSISVYGSMNEPQENITIPGARTPVYKGDVHTGYATVTYYLTRTDYSSVNNTASYNVTSKYYLEDITTLYGDALWINGTHVGNFNSNNGSYSGDQTVWRTESIPITLHSGYNTFETTNIGGVGGDSWDTITITNFATAPEVIGTDGTWYEGEVETGLRTWESLYTDGATGSGEGNKVQTSTGFLYKDIDEQLTPIEPYTNSVLGNNSRITEIKNAATGQMLPLNVYALNNSGTYWIKSCTKDSGGLEGCGSRYIRVLSRKYNIGYAGNGATSGGTSSQTCTVLYNCTLNSNGFRRDFSVGFNGNGGSSSQTSSIASASFLGWMDHNNFNYKGTVYPYWTFNAPFYANYNPDVRNYAGYSKTALIDHWLSTSINNAYENRQSSEFFNIAHYMTYGGGDLNASFGGNREAFVNHFTYNGYYEGRSATAPISGQYDTYPDRATVKDLSMDNGANLTLTAKWKDGSVVLPSATRPGYKLIGWYTAPNGGDKVGNAGDTYTPKSSTTVYAKWDKAPSITASDQTFYEGQYKSDYWISTQRLKGVSASDQEDGNITSRVKVIEDTTKVNVPGTYKVTYQVSDNVGQTASKTVKITVLYNNPPTISGEDRWFYVDEEVTTARLMEYVKAKDIEDGNITSKAKIKSSTVQSGVIGEYKVTYTVTDAFGKTAETTRKVYIVDRITDTTKMYVRHISKDTLDTLHPQSVWRTNPYLKNKLETTLNTPSGDEYAESIWIFTDEEIEKIKQLNEEDGLGEAANKHFLEVFAENKVK